MRYPLICLLTAFLGWFPMAAFGVGLFVHAVIRSVQFWMYPTVGGFLVTVVSTLLIVAYMKVTDPIAASLYNLETVASLS